MYLHEASPFPGVNLIHFSLSALISLATILCFRDFCDSCFLFFFFSSSWWWASLMVSSEKFIWSLKFFKAQPKILFWGFQQEVAYWHWTLFQLRIGDETKSETFRWLPKDFCIHLMIPLFLKKSVSTLSFVGLKLENNCWFWSILIKEFWYCLFTKSADQAEILPRDTNFWRTMSISDSHELFLAGLLIHIGLKNTALQATAYLSSNFSKRWWNSFIKSLQLVSWTPKSLQDSNWTLFAPTCVFCESNINTFWIFSDVLILGIYLYQIIQI